jgi:ABC-type glycerol-3-phosphate transport system permease component
MLDWYFLVQGVCGLLALATAMAWWNTPLGQRTHRARVIVLLVAVITVLAGWPLEQRVSQLRSERNEATDKVLRSAPSVSLTDYEAAVRARTEFGRMHIYSLVLNLGTIALVTAVMVLAAQLPAIRQPSTTV